MDHLASTEHYERVLSPRRTFRSVANRILAILGYLLYLSFWFVLTVRVVFSVYLIALGVISTVVLVFLTWKYLTVEYEYSMVGGVFELSKIFGKKKRKSILKFEIRSLLLAGQATDENLKKAHALNPTETRSALSDDPEAEVWFAVWETGKSERMLFLFEADKRTQNVFRHYNPQAIIRSVR